jgi:hypothetical protein
MPARFHGTRGFFAPFVSVPIDDKQTRDHFSLSSISSGPRPTVARATVSREPGLLVRTDSREIPSCARIVDEQTKLCLRAHGIQSLSAQISQSLDSFATREVLRF